MKPLPILLAVFTSLLLWLALAIAILAVEARAQTIGPQVIPLPVSQANGGTGATSMSAGSVTPTGGSANTLGNILGGVAGVPAFTVTGTSSQAIVNINGNLAGSNPCTSDGDYGWNLENGTGEMDAISCYTGNIGSGNDAFAWWQAPVSGALSKLMSLDKIGNLLAIAEQIGSSITTPSAVLEVNQTNGTSEHIRIADRFSLIGSTNLHITNNAIYNGTNYLYDANGSAMKIELGSNNSFFVNAAPSGSAGGVITWATNLTLDGSGNLTIAGGLTATSLANSAQSNAVCYNSSTGAVTYNSGVTTCLASTIRVKDLKRPIAPDEGLRVAMAAKPWDYTNKVNPQGDEVGLVCEQLEKIDPRLVDHDKQGKCSGVRYEQYAGGILTAAVQKLKHDNDDLRRQIADLRRIVLARRGR